MSESGSENEENDENDEEMNEDINEGADENENENVEPANLPRRANFTINYIKGLIGPLLFQWQLQKNVRSLH